MAIDQQAATTQQKKSLFLSQWPIVKQDIIPFQLSKTPGLLACCLQKTLGMIDSLIYMPTPDDLYYAITSSVLWTKEPL